MRTVQLPRTAGNVIRAAVWSPVPAVVAAAAVLSAPPAHADVRQSAPCAVADRAPGSPPVGVPEPQARFAVEDLWRFSRGAGQTVAVIDTGVAPHPRLPHLVGGGDLVGGRRPGTPHATDGLDDCDAHGTLVAGIIGAAPSQEDGFAGVAPDARILSIRQSSAKYTDTDDRRGAGDEDAAGSPVGAGGTGSIRTLAEAIRMAVDQGATVINISEVACGSGVGSVRSPLLEDAVSYAAARDVVIVAAAGNTGGTCRQNRSERNPLRPDHRAWDTAFTDVAPAHFADHVLTVSSAEPGGAPSEFSLAGPWVTVAAPGSGITSLANDPDGGLADRIRTEHGVTAIEGTSFAAPFVAGLAADIRTRFPALTAPQVTRRIAATAHPGPHGWEPTVGYGVVDPIAALTAPLPVDGARRTGMQFTGASYPGNGGPAGNTDRLAPPPEPAPPGHLARTRALTGTAGIVVLLLGSVLVGAIVRRCRRGEDHAHVPG